VADDSDAPAMANAAADVPSANDEEDARPKFFMSRNFGGEGGSGFDHMNRRRISKMRAGKFEDGVAITHMNGQRLFIGGEGEEEQSIELPEGEYVNEVKLREGEVIQSIFIFITNKGRKLGPSGGGIFAKEGNGVHAKAPRVTARWAFVVTRASGSIPLAPLGFCTRSMQLRATLFQMTFGNHGTASSTWQLLSKG
jgi:hypothetical protein